MMALGLLGCIYAPLWTCLLDCLRGGGDEVMVQEIRIRF